jgi:hypothetical protein
LHETKTSPDTAHLIPTENTILERTVASKSLVASAKLARKVAWLLHGELHVERSEHERSPSRTGRAFDTSNRKRLARDLQKEEPKATGGPTVARLIRGFPMWAFLAIKPRAGRNSRSYPREIFEHEIMNRRAMNPTSEAGEPTELISSTAEV